jgi:hypothetical protein
MNINYNFLVNSDLELENNLLRSNTQKYIGKKFAFTEIDL